MRQKRIPKNLFILLMGILGGQFLAISLAFGVTIFALAIIVCILLVEDEVDPPNAN